jgi:hypothetical protein
MGYNPTLGTFIERDPIPADENAYRYVHNGPTNKTDPSGTAEGPAKRPTDEDHPGEFKIQVDADKDKGGGNSDLMVRYLVSPQDKLKYSEVRLEIQVRSNTVRRGLWGDSEEDSGWHNDTPKDPDDLEAWPENPRGPTWRDNPGVDTYALGWRKRTLHILTFCSACPPRGAILSLDQWWEATAIATRKDNGQDETIGKTTWSHHASYKWYNKGSGRYSGKTGEEIPGECVADVTVTRRPMTGTTYVPPA